MSNTIQLDLFHGVVLTTEQQEEVGKFIQSQAKKAVSREKEVCKILVMLDEAGFVHGKDYSDNFEVEEVTEECRFGYGYNNTEYNHEVTHMETSGNVFLLVNSINKGKLEVYKASLDREGDKLMCTNITKQYRHYKPSSLLTKYKEHNQRKVNELEHDNKQSIALNTIVAKYQRLYPDAEVKIGSDYYRGSRHYNSFPTVRVEFKSGSWVTFKLGWDDKMDQEDFYKKYDATNETPADLLERFNNQKA